MAGGAAAMCAPPAMTCPAMQRLLRSADFERVLASPLRCRSTHFAAHHLPARPGGAAEPRATSGDALAVHAVIPPLSTELSTDAPAAQAALVDDHWLGLVVPKRHARRAVTRNLIKRQARMALAAHAPRLAPGLWVVRLRAPIDRQAHPSARSDALAALLRADLAALLARAEARFAAPAR